MIKIAMLGRSEGNGHPYSWSAIINGGYNEARMKKQPFPMIYEYLSNEPKDNLGIEGAKVTHVWAEDRNDAKDIAACSLIDNVVSSPDDVIGKVDAVIIGEDIGSRHLNLALPFIERNIPIFIDKPLTDNEHDLKIFIKFFEKNSPIMSSSGFSYAKEFENLYKYKLGKITYVNCLMNKSWETYGIHAIAGIYKILGSGVGSIVNLGKKGIETIYLKYKNDSQAVISQIYNAGVSRFDLVGSNGTKIITKFDAFYMFKKQLEDFVNFIRVGKYSYYSSNETIETIKVLISAIESRESGGKKVILT
jgi:predicted dehydrogenase